MRYNITMGQARHAAVLRLLGYLWTRPTTPAEQPAEAVERLLWVNEICSKVHVTVPFLLLMFLVIAGCASPTAPVQLQVPAVKTEPLTCLDPTRLPPDCRP